MIMVLRRETALALKGEKVALKEVDGVCCRSHNAFTQKRNHAGFGTGELHSITTWGRCFQSGFVVGRKNK